MTEAGSSGTRDVVGAVLARQNGNFAEHANPGDSRTRDNVVNLTPTPAAPGSPCRVTPCGRRIYVARRRQRQRPAHRGADQRLRAGPGRAGRSGRFPDKRGRLRRHRPVDGRSHQRRPASFEYCAFARDAVSWAAFFAGQTPADLSREQLIGIYTCAVTDWSDARLPADAGSGRIIRVPPPAGSDSESFFTETVLQGAVVPPDSAGCPLLRAQENSGVAITAQVPAADRGRIIAPYSVAQWIGQSNGRVDDRRADIGIRAIGGVFPLIRGVPELPNTQVINDGSFLGARLVYNLLDSRSPSYADALRAVGFDASGPSVLCGGGYAAILLEWGFTPLPDVGATTCVAS